MFVEGGSGWRPEPEEEPAPRRRRPLPWRPFAVVVALSWLWALTGLLEGFAAYVGLLVWVTVAALLAERWIARRSYGGLRGHRQ